MKKFFPQGHYVVDTGPEIVENPDDSWGKVGIAIGGCLGGKIIQ